jgi:hypothetical protein
LEYEAYETMALSEMERIGADIERRSVISIAMVHRVGVVPIGGRASPPPCRRRTVKRRLRRRFESIAWPWC